MLRKNGSEDETLRQSLYLVLWVCKPTNSHLCVGMGKPWVLYRTSPAVFPRWTHNKLYRDVERPPGSHFYYFLVLKLDEMCRTHGLLFKIYFHSMTRFLLLECFWILDPSLICITLLIKSMGCQKMEKSLRFVCLLEEVYYTLLWRGMCTYLLIGSIWIR